MTALPIRTWLALALAAVVAVPTVASLAVFALHRPTPEVSFGLDPALRQEVVDAVDRWADPAWQATIAPKLAAAGVGALLVDGAGREVYRNVPQPPAAPGDAPPTTTGRGRTIVTTRELLPGTEFVVTDGGRRLGTAHLYALPRTTARFALPVVAPDRFDLDLWLPQLTQLGALVAIAAGAAWFVDRAVLKPLAAMGRAAHAVAAGDLAFRLPPSRVWEVAEVAAAFTAMGDALRTSLERQAELEQERRLFVGAVVHDLRTPLFALRGYLEGLATGLADSPEKAARYLGICREKAAALERLIADLFAYTRTEYLDQAPHPEPLELGELLTRIVDGLRPQAAAKGVRLELDAPGASCPFAGDPHLLTRAVENLLDNAIRHAPADGSVRVGWERTPDGASFTVADTGRGIPPHDLRHLFAPLYRGETSRNRRSGGAGLGLTIARRILQAHGGDLTAANAPGGGAVFTGYLATDAAAARSPATERPLTSPLGNAP